MYYKKKLSLLNEILVPSKTNLFEANYAPNPIFVQEESKRKKNSPQLTCDPVLREKRNCYVKSRNSITPMNRCRNKAFVSRVETKVGACAVTRGR